MNQQQKDIRIYLADLFSSGCQLKEQQARANAKTESAEEYYARTSKQLSQVCKLPEDLKYGALNPRVCSSIFAAGHFLTQVEYLDGPYDPLLQIVLCGFRALLLSPETSSATQNCIVEQFAKDFIKYAILIMERKDEWCTAILSGLKPFLESVVNDPQRAHIVRGVLNAIAHTKSDFSKFVGEEDILRLIESLDALVKSENNELFNWAVLAISRFVCLPSCPDDIFQRYFAFATDPDVVAKHFNIPIKLAIACTENDTFRTLEVIRIIEPYLTMIMRKTTLSESSSKKQQVSVTSHIKPAIFILESLETLYCRLSEIPSKAIDDAINFCLSECIANTQPEVNARAAEYLCNLLQKDMANRDNDEVVESVVSKLLSLIQTTHNTAISASKAAAAAAKKIPSADFDKKKQQKQAQQQQQQQQQNKQKKQSELIVSTEERLLMRELNALKSVYRMMIKKNSQEIPDQITSGLVRILPLEHLERADKAIIHALIGIASLSTAEGTKEIVSQIVKIYQRIVFEAEKSGDAPDPFVAILSTELEKLGKELSGGSGTNDALKRDICTSFLLLFRQFGQKVRASSGVPLAKNPCVVVMGHLLSVIAEFLEAYREEDILSPDEPTQQLARSVWFYCVFLDFARPMGEAETEAIARCARKLPVIAATKAHELMKIEKELDELLGIVFSRSELSAMGKRLTRTVGCAQNNVQNSSMCAYLLAVYYLEVLRVRGGEHRALFAYMKGLSAIPAGASAYTDPMLAVLRSVGDKVFCELLNSLVVERFSDTRTSDSMATVCEFLLLNYCSSNTYVRSAADLYLSQLTGTFPQMLWHPHCVSVLLELVDVLAKTVKGLQPLDKTHRNVPGTSHYIDLPEDAAGVSRMHTNMVLLCRTWLREAIERAPSEMYSVLQRFTERFTSSAAQGLARVHFGVALASEALNTAKPVAAALAAANAAVSSQSASGGGAATATGSSAAGAGATGAEGEIAAKIKGFDDAAKPGEYMVSLENKTQYIGEVNGMTEVLESTGLSKEDALLRVADLLLRKLDAVGDGEKEEKEGAHMESCLASAVFKACAFVVQHKEHSRVQKLLDRIVWAPVQAFTKASLETGTSAWAWLLPALGRLSAEYLMSQIWLAWSWTIDNRMGLFSDSPRPLSPLSVKQASIGVSESESEEERAAAAKKRAKDDCAPHRIWLQFLSERLTVSQNSENGQVKILLKMLYKACADPGKLSVLSESFGTRFRMLLLAIRVALVMKEWRVQQLQLQSIDGQSRPAVFLGAQNVTEMIFVDRILSAALSWFQLFPSWYEPASRTVLQEDVTAILCFARLLQSEHFCSTFTLPASSTIDTDDSNSDDTGSTSSASSASSSRRMSAFFLDDHAVPQQQQQQQSVTPRGKKGAGNSSSSGGVSAVLNTPRRSFSVHSSGGGSTSSSGSRGSAVVPAVMKLNTIDINAAVAAAAADAAGGCEDPVSLQRIQLLIYLLGCELERVTVWNNPLGTPQKRIDCPYAGLREPKVALSEYANVAWGFAPSLAVMFWIRHKGAADVENVLRALVLKDPSAVQDCPEALPLLVTEEAVRRDIPQLHHLLYWAGTDPLTAMSLLRKEYNSHPLVTQYALRVMREFSAETVIFYIPQLVQSLRYDKSGLVEEYLVEAAGRSELLAHQLIWNMRNYPREAPAGYRVDSHIALVAERVRNRVVENFPPDVRQRYEQEFNFFDEFTAISSRLLPIDREHRKEKLMAELEQVHPPQDDSIYLPFSPDIVVRHVDATHPSVLRSAAKVPIMVHFDVCERGAPADAPTHPYSCIFKSGDDTRQDMLALQVIELLRRVFDSAGLGVYLFPYRIISTLPECGMIEVVPNSLSRDQIGQKTGDTMYDYFLAKYGPRSSPEFQEARNNFIRSMAGYSVASYILQVKDRHNGNILIDDSGHLIHIDFGFLFDISPGGDIGFEKAPFKLTDEMISIMGSLQSDQYAWFMEQVVRAFLSSREYMDGFVTLVDLMVDTQLPCFKPRSLINLASRFFPSQNVPDAAKSMIGVINSALSFIGSTATYLYDKFQEWDNGIAM